MPALVGEASEDGTLQPGCHRCPADPSPTPPGPCSPKSASPTPQSPGVGTEQEKRPTDTLSFSEPRARPPSCLLPVGHLGHPEGGRGSRLRSQLAWGCQQAPYLCAERRPE